MEALPDDALLAVLHRLADRDLVRCRRVCRRLSDLVGHPELWRDRDITSGVLLMSPPPPRCRRLVLTGWGQLPVHAAATARTTTCAAAGVSVLVDEHPLVAVGIIRRQVKLGRLHELAIAFLRAGLLNGAFHGGLPGSLRGGDTYLLKFVLQVRGLRELNIGYSSTYSFTTGWKCPVPPSLMKLSYGGLNGALLKVILRAHAATLEEVRLDHLGDSDHCSDEVVDLLASIAHPWELHCPFVPGLDKLAKCRSLTSLRLTALDHVYHAHVEDAKNFFRLSNISRFYVKGMGEMVVDLIKTLGETGSPKVTHVEAEIELSRGLADTINHMPVYLAQKAEMLKHCDYLPSLKEFIIGGERVLPTPRD